MKLAVTLTTPEVPRAVPVALFAGSFPERLAKAAQWGYAGVELMVRDPTELDAGAIGRAIREAGLQVAAIGTGAQFLVDGLTLVSADAGAEQKAFERFCALADFAAAVGAPLVTIGSFRGRLGQAGEGARQRLIARLRDCAEYAGRRGLRVALEPLNRYEADFIHTAAEGMALVEEIAHPAFGLLLDTFHMNIEEASVRRAVHTAAPRLWHVHLGDSNRLPPGKGHFAFGRMLRALVEVGYDRFLSAELLAQPDPDTAGIQTALAMRRLMCRYAGGERGAS